MQNLPNALTERDLYELFRDAVGPVMSCKVARDPRTGESRCYGFVHFENDNDADDALKLSGKVIGEQTIEVVPFVRKAERPTAEKMFTNVYVKNLPDSVDNEKIVELFSKFGKVTCSRRTRTTAE